jgi:DNA-binding LacI/PurR family transcriptional regulator
VTSIHDIARAARCSISTVSCAINGKGRVNAATRSRILAACTALGYAPNAAGRHLRLQRSETVGLLLYPTCASEFRNSFAAEVIEGLEDRLIAANYHLLLGGYHPQVGPGAVPQFIGQGRVDGAVLLGNYPARILDVLAGLPLPLLLLDSEHGQAIDSLTTDGYAAGMEAVRHLALLGHRRIAMLAYGHDFPNPRQRRLGFAAALQAHGLGGGERALITSFHDHDEGYRQLRARLAEADAPSALFCENDPLALALIARLAADGIRVPHQLSVVGFNDDEAGRASAPPLTTFQVDKPGLGRRGADMILARIADPLLPRAHVRLPAGLCVRGTTAPWRS